MSDINDIPNCEILVMGFKWVQKLFITGHYVFEIKIIERKSAKERLIERRFSEMEWLNKNLIKTDPGCRIPFLPEKNVWCKLNLNNEAELEIRKEKIQAYLTYINHHKYLSKNPYFQIFLSDSFKVSDNEILDENQKISKIDNQKKESGKGFLSGGKSIFKKMAYYMPTNIPFYGGGLSSQSSGSSQLKNPFDISQVSYDDEKENFIRMQKGIDDLTKNFKESIVINETKIKALSEFIENAKSLKDINFDYHKQKLDDSENDNPTISDESKNINKIQSYLKKIEDFNKSIEEDLLAKLNDFKVEIEEILQIFERKEKKEVQYIENNISDDTEFIIKFDEEILYEIGLFKNKKQGGIVQIFEQFYSLKLEADLQIDQMFNSKL